MEPHSGGRATPRRSHALAFIAVSYTHLDVYKRQAPEFDDLAKEVGLGSHQQGVTDPVQRARLRAELDGRIAHLYGLSEAEFTHILTTFPLVDEAVKVAALHAYREEKP